MEKPIDEALRDPLVETLNERAAELVKENARLRRRLRTYKRDNERLRQSACPTCRST